MDSKYQLLCKIPKASPATSHGFLGLPYEYQLILLKGLLLENAS